MKKMFFAALLCCSLLGVSYGQGQSKTQDCKTKEGHWDIDVGVGRVGGSSRETHCEDKGSSPKDPKEPKGPERAEGHPNRPATVRTDRVEPGVCLVFAAPGRTTRPPTTSPRGSV